jgi:hypothetical protein
MNNKPNYIPKYPVGYVYKVGHTDYFIEKIENGVYFERSSRFVGYVCSRCDVFDANRDVARAVPAGIGLPVHPEDVLNNKF